MTIRDKICREKYGNVEIVSKHNQDIIQALDKQIINPTALIPSRFYKDWMKGQDSVINKLSISLLKDYPIECKCGYKTKQFFVTSLLGFDIKDFIKRKWGVEVDFTQHKLLSYDFRIYRILVVLVMSLTVSKYRIESLYHEHIIFICVKVMLTFFTLYKDDKFLVELNHAHDMAKKIFNTEISVFKTIAERLGFAKNEQEVQEDTIAPTREEIMKFISPEDSQTTIKNKIMKWYLCKDRKARSIMQQFGLTDPKYTRKDYRKEKVEEVIN